MSHVVARIFTCAENAKGKTFSVGVRERMECRHSSVECQLILIHEIINISTKIKFLIKFRLKKLAFKTYNRLKKPFFVPFSNFLSSLHRSICKRSKD
jgi:hypothetical protein